MKNRFEVELLKKTNRQAQPFTRVPAPPSGPSRRKKKPIGKAVITAIVICSLLVVVGVAAAVYVNQMLGLVDREELVGNPDLKDEELVDDIDDFVEAPDSTEAIQQAAKEYDDIIKVPQRVDKKVYNILLIGSDARPGEKNGRSDAMIIMSINQETKSVHLTSLMRAMYVNIPGKGWSMLNHSFSWGGPKLLIATIEENLRIKIDDYVVIKFDGFTKAVDKVGGVTINLTAAEARQLGGGRTAGDNLLSGQAALDYSRIRKLDSDFERTGRQRAVIEALIKKSRSLSLGQMNDLAREILPLVNTNLSQGQILSLLADMFQAREYPISQLMLPEESYRQMIYVRKMEMYRFDFKIAVNKLHNFIYGG